MKFVLICILFGFNSLAQDRQVQRVVDLASQVERLTFAKASSLDQDQLRALTLSLRESMKILSGRDDGRDDDRRDRNRFCSTEPNYQDVFEKVKFFAYVGSGLNYSSSNATNFALDLTRSNSCADSLTLIENMQVLKDFAFSLNGLNYGISASINFALEKARVLCMNSDFQNQFKIEYDRAYSPRGMNMSSEAARRYAYDKIEAMAFSCRL